MRGEESRSTYMPPKACLRGGFEGGKMMVSSGETMGEGGDIEAEACRGRTCRGCVQSPRGRSLSGTSCRGRGGLDRVFGRGEGCRCLSRGLIGQVAEDSSQLKLVGQLLCARWVHIAFPYGAGRLDLCFILLPSSLSQSPRLRRLWGHAKDPSPLSPRPSSHPVLPSLVHLSAPDLP